MSFTASANIGDSKHFGEDSGERVLYDGPYVPGPYHITATARELDPTSDDEFTDGSGDLSVDPGTLQGNSSVTISQTPGDKDDTDVGDQPNDPDDPDETASFTISFRAEISPVVEITNIDVVKNEIRFDILPENLSEGQVLVVISSKASHNASKQPDIKISQQISGGRGKTVQFDWSKFPQNPGTQFHAQSVTIYWNNLSAMAKPDTREVAFTGYGAFLISKYISPDESLFPGPTQRVAVNARCAQISTDVKTSWMQRVNGEEGKGWFRNELYDVKACSYQVGKKEISSYRLLSNNREGACVARLAVNRSLARREGDERFSCGDTILLSNAPGLIFKIEDSGRWKPATDINHLDRFAGRGGPGGNADFGQAYVVKVPGL